MDIKSISAHIEKIEKAINSYAELLKVDIKANNRIVAGYITPLVPPEIMSAFNIELLKIPETVIKGTEAFDKYSDIYNTVILPDTDISCINGSFKDANIYRFTHPSGYGEDAAVAFHNEISSMLKSIFSIDIRTIDIQKLQQRTMMFEMMRRTVRSITALRSENIEIMTCEEISLIFEAAEIFPADIAYGLLAPLLDDIKKISAGTSPGAIRALFSGGRSIPAGIADFIEKSGIALIEDDTCTGRRLFDISLNSESEFIFYEILDAYTYRPASPCTRKKEERYELLYKLLRNYGIELVILFNDGKCSYLPEHIEYLRVRLMRDGVDPLVINNENYREVIERYMGSI